MEQLNRQAKQRQHNDKRSIIKFLQGIAFSILIFAIIFAIHLITAYCIRLKPFTNYAIVFDAGSSHTEMFVYDWPADKSHGLGTTSAVNEFFVCQLERIIINDPIKRNRSIKFKAISDFEENLNLLQDYFRPCLDQAILKIPSNRHKFTPIFLGATAGMRLARLHNKTKARQTLETIREIFSHTPFQFVRARQVRILTGMEEAIDGWITTNILLENFNHRHAKKSPLTSVRIAHELDSDMVGVLDLGGASTQITFTHNHNINDESIPDEFTTHITLFNTVYSPYTHSYLCWGKNEAFRRHRARLVNAVVNSRRKYSSKLKRILILDPCLPRGTNDTWTMSSLFYSPCTANEKQRLNPYINESLFKFVGGGNANQCRQRLINLFDAKRNDRIVNCSFKQEYCTFDQTFQPDIPPNIDFIALAGYYYVINNLAYRMTKPNNDSSRELYRFKDFSREEFDRRLIDVCETSYEVLYHQESMTPSNEKHKRGLCFDAWYIWLLLTYAIGFKENDLDRLSFAIKFPTGKVGWTLGYMINQTNYIPAEYRERTITTERFIGWLLASLAVTFTASMLLLITCYIYCKQRSATTGTNRTGYAQTSKQTNV